MDQPTYAASSRTSLTIRWSPPADEGGCPVHDYAVYSAPSSEDGKLKNTWTVVNPLDRTDPNLEEFVCETFPGTSVLGDHFVFKIVASN